VRLETCADLEPLIESLAQRLRTPLSDPMAQEIIVVPVADMANYLKRELGRRLGDSGKNNGIVANVNFAYPRELINATPAMPTGVSKSPWDATRLTWSIMSLISSNVLKSLPKSFSTTPLSSARRAAELFDRYASHRPEMLRGWADGHKYDVSSNGTQDWQVEVFKLLNAHLRDVPESQRSVVDFDSFVNSLNRDALPQRISFFGIQALSRAALDVITALDAVTDVAVYWLYAPGAKMPTTIEPGTARNEYAQIDIQHPLYSRWGARVLESRTLITSSISDSDTTIVPALTRSDSLLHRLQNGVLNDQHVSHVFTDDEMAEILKHGDGSIQIHACYGLHRQVEALRDALLHALNNDPSLRLRDILIVCNDVAAAAPVLNSILDPEDTVGDNVPRLPINVLKGAISRPDEATQAFLEILQLVTGRCSANQLLDVASLAPVRRAFGLDDNALELLERWTDQLGVQFGLNTAHRKIWNIADTITNGTWQLAIERLMLGIAVPADRDIIGPADVVPYDAIGTSELVVAGTLAEFLARITALHADLRIHQSENSLSFTTWNGILLAVIDNFIDMPRSASDVLARLRRSIQQMYADASAEIDVQGQLFSLRDLILITKDYITNNVSDFWSQFESITVADFGGMNSIPFKVIAFVGADESAFARSRADGDDVLSNEPRVGEPQYSLSGRENFMNLLMAAQEKIIVTCTGADVRNNKDIPLSVPIQELLEHLASLISTKSEHGGQRILVQHSRHNFDIRTLQPGHVRDDIAFTFDKNSSVVWRTLNDQREDRSDSLKSEKRSVQISAEAPHVRDVQQLIKIISNPISFYYREILHVDIPQGPSSEDEFNKDSHFDGDGVLALHLSNLEFSSEGRRLLQLIANFNGPHDINWLDAVITEWLSVRPLTGLLPPGRIGDVVSHEIAGEVRKMISLLPVELQTLQGEEVDCDLTIGTTTASFRIADVIETDDTAKFARVRFKRFSDSLLLELWVELAILTAHRRGKLVVAHLVTRSSSSTSTKPTCYQAQIRGNSDDERLHNAERALAVVHAISTIASHIPVDFFPKASLVLSQKKYDKVDKELQSDTKYDPELAWYLDGQTLSDLQQSVPTEWELQILQAASHTKDPVTSRIEMYASFVWDAFNATCEQSEITTPTKISKTKSVKGAPK